MIQLFRKTKLILFVIVGLVVLVLVYVLDPSFTRREKPKPSTYNLNQSQETAEPNSRPTDYPAGVTKEDITNQQQAEQDFSQGIRNVTEKYPWYTQLPIDTKDYMILYDWDQQKFMISLKYPAGASNLKVVQNSALDALKAIGVDPTKEGYYMVTQ